MGAVTDGEAAAGCGDAGEAGQCGAPGRLGSGDGVGWGLPGRRRSSRSPGRCIAPPRGLRRPGWVGLTGRALGPPELGARWSVDTVLGTGSSRHGGVWRAAREVYLGDLQDKKRLPNRRLRPRRLRKGAWGRGVAGLGGWGGGWIGFGGDKWGTVGVCGLKAEIRGRFGGGVDISDGQPEPEFALVPTW